MTQRKIALSIEEAADYTGIGRNTLRKLVEWKKLPVLKVGRKVLIKTDMLELFMEANEGRGFIYDICTNMHHDCHYGIPYWYDLYWFPMFQEKQQY